MLPMDFMAQARKISLVNPEPLVFLPVIVSSFRILAAAEYCLATARLIAHVF
jgi:hypothetical protein